MIGELYLGSALAIFLAIFGFSEQLFGLSSKNVQLILDFCKKTNLSYNKYTKLIELINKSNMINTGEYTKEMVKLLKDSKIETKDKTITDKLKDNAELINSLNSINFIKKVYFFFLFLFMFFYGSIFIYYEIKLVDITSLFVYGQVILLEIIFICMGVYFISTKKEKLIHNNLMEITTKIKG